MKILKSALLIVFIFDAILSFPTSNRTREIHKAWNKKLIGDAFTCSFSSKSCETESKSVYSNLDGSCNNLKNPTYGRTQSPFKRLLPANYDDGVDSARNTAVSGSALPNPRVLSLGLNSDNNEIETVWTHIFTTFGQFLTHDLGETSFSSNDGSKPDCPCDSEDSSCFSINMPDDDVMDMTCMKFIRSSGSFEDPDTCSGEKREQVNFINSYIDASTVYGNSEEESAELRAFSGGLLKTSDGIEENRPYLPNDEDNTCSADSDDLKCFKSGDSRTSENLGLTGIHTVFLREHNSIAIRLAEMNEDWDDEKIFQETRRIIIAILQHIVYDQYVPSVIGDEGNALYGLDPTEDGTYFTGYDSSINPQLYNEFATAAMRFGHSVVHNAYDRYNSNNEFVDNDLNFTHINFKSDEAFNTEKGGIDAIVMGLINTHSGKCDLSIPDDLQNRLLDAPGSAPIDLAAFNINRGRDHGLQPYVKYFEYCNGQKINSFEDIDTFTTIHNSSLKSLVRLYENAEDIDLWIGGLAEIPVGNADVVVGPTFTCIIGEQFRDLKRSDRFYYENAPDAEKGTENTAFTLEQLAEIKKMSLSTLLCNNLDIVGVQRDVFFIKTRTRVGNQEIIPCSDYEQMDLSKW